MRVLFSAVPVAGHVLPLLPMAAAARSDGHEVAVLTGAGLAELVEPIPLLSAGPPIEAQVAETVRRTGRRWAGPGPEAAEMFAGTRVDLTYRQALARAEAFGPDLVVCDSCDYVGPTVAVAVGASWATHAISGALPPAFSAAMDTRWAAQLRERGLRYRPRLGYVDPYPELLRQPGEPVPPDRLPVRFTAFDRPGAIRGPSPFEDTTLPRVLLTLGTSVADPHLSAALATSLADADVNVLVTDDGTADLAASPRIRHVGFVPLARLLPDVDLVVAAGGTGTLLSALAAGLPLVLHPQLADQPLNAARATRLGAARTIDRATDAGPAAQHVLATAGYRHAAQRVEAQIGAQPAPEQVLGQLLDRARHAAA
jgi:UDP:flavonoid glycosyltransferase YjiC (YdhE family)